MEVKSVSECLNRIDDMIFDKTLKVMIKDEIERIRIHIGWEKAGGDFIEEKLVVLPELSQINYIKERLYSDDCEDELDKQYNKLRLRILEWYDEINTKPENSFISKKSDLINDCY